MFDRRTSGHGLEREQGVASLAGVCRALSSSPRRRWPLGRALQSSSRVGFARGIRGPCRRVSTPRACANSRLRGIANWSAASIWNPWLSGTGSTGAPANAGSQRGRRPSADVSPGRVSPAMDSLPRAKCHPGAGGRARV